MTVVFSCLFRRSVWRQEKILHAAPLSTIETLPGRKNKPVTAQRCSQSDPKLLLSIVVVLGQKKSSPTQDIHKEKKPELTLIKCQAGDFSFFGLSAFVWLLGFAVFIRGLIANVCCFSVTVFHRFFLAVFQFWSNLFGGFVVSNWRQYPPSSVTYGT